MATLLEMAQNVAESAIGLEAVEFGPWLGSVRSVSADQVGRDWMTAGSNFLWVPRALLGSDRSLGYSYGTFQRRGGQTIRFDTLPTPVGLLPASWADAAAPLNAKARWLEEFLDDAICTDGVPTLAALVTKEAVASGLDDGRFSQFWLRDQVNNLNYTWGDEYSTDTYPALGSIAAHRITPLWYDSGDGGLTRGTSEFARRFFFCGSRRFLKVGGWHYFPSVLGTPSRAQRRLETRSSEAGLLASSDITAFGTEWATTGAATQWQAIQTKDDTTSFAHRHGDVGTYNFDLGLAGTLITSINTWTITYRARREGTAPISGTTFAFGVTRSDNLRAVSANIDATALTTSWVDYTTTVFFGGTASGAGANSLRLNAVVPLFFDGYIEITYVRVSAGTASTTTLIANRLTPSGPLPPLHAGSLSKGTAVSEPGVVIRPDADITDGGWLNSLGTPTNVDLYSYIDETTPPGLLDPQTDYISSASGGAACVIGLGNPGFTPSLSNIVKVSVTTVATGTGGSLSRILTVRLMQGAVAIRTHLLKVYNNAAWTTREITLTASEVGSISDWNDLRLEFTNSSDAGVTTRIAHAALYTIPGTIETEGQWRGSDRFYYSVAYRFEDGSVWAPCMPRAPNSLLIAGFNLFTVDLGQPDTTYDKITWSSIPIGPHGTVGRILLRTPKISAVSDDNMQLDPFDLRVVWEIKDNTTTTYDDYYGADEALGLDVFKAFIRFDHMMPPRSRYIFGGDMRICHSYGGQNPCAIEIAPVGRAADYDLNLADDDATAYTSQASFMQIGIDTSGAGTLTLIQGDGATATDTLALTFTAYTTLQQLVDKINSTSFAVEGQQWRAQLCPGTSPDATTLSLTPHNRAIASCVVSGQTITKAAGGLSKVAVGQRIDGTGVTAGAYVSRIDSDTQLTFVGTIAAATVTLYFFNDLGDSQITTPANGTQGYQRVICGALPAFLYFTKSYLDDDPVHKDTVWMTVASPGQMKSAANNFSGKQSNRFAPPNAQAGISMGGGPADQGFVTPYSGAIYAIKNTRDTSSGIDEDYKMVALNESEGCCAWNTVVPGNRFVPYLKPSGFYAADLDREIWLSEAVFKPPSSDATLGIGDLDYEIPLCVAASAADTDAAYASARILRRTLWVSYRDSGSRPDRNLRYDFSGGIAQVGLPALLRDDGRTPWGWSNELVLPITPSLMVAGRRGDGEHLYGWSEANAGSTGDGRIDEFETGDTDNGTAIVGSVVTPWEKGDEQRQVSGQEVLIEHVSPAASTGFIDFTRCYAEDLYSLTPSTGSTVVIRDSKMLPMAARVQSAACKLGYRQLTGGAREVRKMTLRLKRVRAFK